MYTKQQWAADGTFKAQPGDEVEAEVFSYFFDVMPILGDRRMFLVLEPVSFKDNAYTFACFQTKDDKHIFIGDVTKKEYETLRIN